MTVNGRRRGSAAQAANKAVLALLAVTETPTTRDRILTATVELLAEGGRDAVSTRAISAAAKIQVPTIYRTFGDLRGLLDSAAATVFASALADYEQGEPPTDPVDALRAAWDHHVAFGLAQPHLYALIFTERTGEESEGARLARGVLTSAVRTVAEAGRLTVEVERAGRLVQSAALGCTLTLLVHPDDELSVRSREAVLSTLTTSEVGPADPAARATIAHAVALRAALPGLDVLSAGERALLDEWLLRLAR
ncbi:TetR/AcrR family transcriptional regulator [Rathayibacter toxicus]|uniref:TetR/AcrR family transcriptional regulator n=1 Tax=Rathayibacter toxicus TaxID=145458 RepID=A0A2S5Y573_9MICO|nr:TetR/AcrR family transcriptional regulator [Rathayibacter toxicus]PPH56166.1 TetR/AcrR family transcriptional regulator [Rathayibacter toxicus]PPH58261.1 TetR/AcrR family transcriptional regulator [Rathayibacter toxicus]PPH86008.1 TetR/AcrR family transcriptional regulator [Rathayibacter toxicus]PPI13891.1 TetR/AcrR family transcriptional regulator [Rathayibacter toxicus]